MTFVLPGGLGQLFAPHVYTAWATNGTGTKPPGWGTVGTTPTFSNQNRSVTCTAGGYSYVSGASFDTTGQVYFEVTCAGAGANTGNLSIGVVNNAYTWKFPGGDTTGVALNATGAGGDWEPYYNAKYTFTTGLIPANGDVIGVAVDFTTSGQMNVNFRVNANWCNKGAPSTTFPSGFDQTVAIAAGTGGIILGVPDGSGLLTLNTGYTAFAHAIPPGYAPWG